NGAVLRYESGIGAFGTNRTVIGSTPVHFRTIPADLSCSRPRIGALARPALGGSTGIARRPGGRHVSAILVRLALAVRARDRQHPRRVCLVASLWRLACSW